MSSSIPRWGPITASPHQFLIHLRRGEVLRAQQGGSCFRWPGDAVALVDTSVKRLQFTADQVTQEKAGVQVTGLAVYRIVQPMVAYRMLDLERQDAVDDILREMLLGATRRLVANLKLQDCLTRRKDALAVELMAEIGPVVAGGGRADDTTEGGWGIALDTIEVQDVRVLSSEVFERLQSPYREQLALAALTAKAEVRREEARLKHEVEKAAEGRRRAMLELEEQRVVAQRGRAAAAAAAEIEQERIRSTHDRSEQRVRMEAVWREAEAAAESDRVVAERRAEAERVLGSARADVARDERAALDAISEARLQELLLTDTLPEVARAFSDSFERIVVTGASDLSVLGQGVGQVVSTLSALGVRLPGQSSE